MVFIGLWKGEEKKKIATIFIQIALVSVCANIELSNINKKIMKNLTETNQFKTKRYITDNSQLSLNYILLYSGI